jgi:hypothetical protein
MIIDNPVLCTDVKVTCVSVEGCVNREENVKDVGSITSDSDFTFEFGLNKEFSEKIPIQFQISYTKRDKSKYIRVINLEFSTTRDRTKAVTFALP